MIEMSSQFQSMFCRYSKVIINQLGANIIALGLIKGISSLGMKKPIVLKMKVTNIQQAKQIITASGFNMVLTQDLDEAATKAVKMTEILKMASEAKLNVSLL